MRYIHVALAAALAVAISGCGGGGTSASPAPGSASGAPASSGGDPQAAFTLCLQKNGVTLPPRPTARPSDRPSGGLGGGQGGGFRSMSPEMQKAFQACSSLRPGGGFGGGNGGGNGAALTAFRTCMKDNGAVVPQGAGVRNLDTSDPKVTKALKKCGLLLPSPAPSPSA